MKNKDSSSWSEIKALDERLTRDPDSFCFARLSEIYLKEGLLADALYTARQGVSKHPGYLAGQRALAMACNAGGLHEEARIILEQVTAAMPEDTVAQKLLARLYVESGDTVSAVRAYSALLDFTPDDAQSRARMEELLQASADRPFQGTLPSEPAVVDDMIVEYTEEDIYDLSEEDIVYDDEEVTADTEVALAVPPADDTSSTVRHDPFSTLTLAELYENQGFIVKALDIYRTILADDPANAELQDKITTLESQVSDLQSIPGQSTASTLDDEQEPAASVGFGSVPPPLDSQAFSPLAHQTADNVVGTLDCWLENIRRIKACR